MITRKLVLAGVAAVAVSAGAAGAIAATSTDERKEAETAILADAAKRLEVSPSELRDALAKAQDAQIDAAVKAGEITQAQADAMKERRAARGTVLGLGGRGGPGGPGGRGPHGPRGFGGPGGMADAAATALGIERSELFSQLRDGKTLAEIARAEGKTLAAVKAAVKTAVTQRLAAAVKAGDITDAQRDHVVGEFDEHFDRFAEGGFKRGRGFGPGGPPPMAPDAGPGNRNGADTLPAMPGTDAS